jgi:RNA polymerase sigma-70 factor (ECF subfamily)
MNQSNRSDLVLELFDAYYDRVYAFARKSAGPAVAEDVTQEVFIRLMQHPRLESLTISISYLLKIAHNLLRRRYTRSSRLIEILDEHVRPAAQRRHAESETCQIDVDRNQVNRALDRLNDEEQDAIRLIVCEGRSYAHAARSLDVSVTTINNWKHRGLAKLRNHLDSTEAYRTT